MKQPVSSGQKSKIEMNIHKRTEDDILNETLSLQQIKKNLIEKSDTSKIDAMVKLEESLDFPYYLHGVQQSPEKKVIASQ